MGVRARAPLRIGSLSTQILKNTQKFILNKIIICCERFRSIRIAAEMRNECRYVVVVNTVAPAPSTGHDESWGVSVEPECLAQIRCILASRVCSRKHVRAVRISAG
jgi:hypothetical protein